MNSRRNALLLTSSLLAIACGGSGQSDSATVGYGVGNPGAPGTKNPGALPGDDTPGGGAQGGSGGQGGGDGGSGAQGGGGMGGSGGGGGDCVSACQAAATECGGNPGQCAAICAQYPNGASCFSSSGCDDNKLAACLAGGMGGMGGSGAQGGGGSGGMAGGGGGGMGGGGGSCEYPTCSGCTDNCDTCMCATQGNAQQCSAYCG
jgi:hypothetical protein